MPRVGHGRQDPAGRNPAENPVNCVAQHHPRPHRRGHRGGRQDQQHRDQDELRRHHVIGPDRELDARHQRVDSDQQGARSNERAHLAGASVACAD